VLQFGVQPDHLPLVVEADGGSARAQDMGANVYEWVWDKITSGRGVRGGSWLDPPWNARASLRGTDGSLAGNINLGFRCAQ